MLFNFYNISLKKARLSGEISVNLKWKGFPTPVTSALSMPNPKKPDSFEHYVFSWREFTLPTQQAKAGYFTYWVWTLLNI